MKLLKHIFLLVFLLISEGGFAQRRISADVEVKTLTGKNVTTVTKSVYCSNNGRLVICFHTPMEYVMETDIMGECQFFFPRTNEVYVDNSRTISSTDELLSIFLAGRMDDLGLSLSGYTLERTESLEDGMMKKSYKTKREGFPPRAQIVYNSEYLPIYSEALTEDGHISVKVYYSNYKMVGYSPFPFRSTEIIYNSSKDSTIVRTIYSNLVLDGTDSMFDFKVPEDAKPMDLTASRNK